MPCRNRGYRDGIGTHGFKTDGELLNFNWRVLNIVGRLSFSSFAIFPYYKT